jgi:hypothetical protein
MIDIKKEKKNKKRKTKRGKLQFHSDCGVIFLAFV